MEKTLIRVLTQYHDENGKPKGGQEFEFKADADYFLMAEDEAIQAIKKMLIAFESNPYGNNIPYAGRHEYISHELIFHPTIQLNSENFEVEIHKILDSNNVQREEAPNGIIYTFPEQ